MPAALPDWARAHGGPVFSASLRATDDDFVVDEILDVDFSGDGEHDWLRVEKRGNNTDWVARQLARHASVRPADVGYAGLKDRHAVTTQWFSVWRKPAANVDWRSLSVAGVRVLGIERHRRKLKRGAHAGNRFRITARAEGADRHAAGIAARVDAIRAAGAPNYFGEQRFGRDGGNIELALAVLAGKRVARHQRGLALSAARSYVFNAIVDTRVRAGNWNRILVGERANLDGSGSVFDVDDVTDDLDRRCAELDIHPTAALWGEGAPFGSLDVADLETAAVCGFDRTTKRLADGLEAARVDVGYRPTRLRVDDFEVDCDSDAVRFAFRLASGGYATAVLREIVRNP